MNDIQRIHRPSSRSPRRASTQLGELEFSDWYEIPVFEQDEEERIEEIATSGRGPRRLVARARIARDARREHRRPEWDAPAPRTAAAARPTPPTTAARPAPAPTPAPAPAPPKASAPDPEPAPEPAPKAASAPKAAPKAAPKVAAEAAPEPTLAEIPAASPAREPAPEPVTDGDAESWVTSGPALTDETMQLDLERESIWRRRFNNFLDRWAASEMAVANRLDNSLERVISPKTIPDLISAATRRGDSD